MATTPIETLVRNVMTATFDTLPAKVYFTVAPQDCKPPYAILVVSDSAPALTLTQAADLWNSHFVVTLIGRTYEECSTLVNSMMTALAPTAPGTFSVGSLERGEDGWDPDTRFYVSTLSFSAWHRA